MQNVPQSVVLSVYPGLERRHFAVVSRAVVEAEGLCCNQGTAKIVSQVCRSKECWLEMESKEGASFLSNQHTYVLVEVDGTQRRMCVLQEARMEL